MKKLFASLDWRFVLALLVLHAWFVMPFPWEQGSFLVRALRLDTDFAILLTLGLCAMWLTNSNRVVPWILAVFVLATPVYRFGHTIMPAVYGKDFEPLTDAAMLDGLVHLLTHEYALTQRVLLLIAAGLGLLLVYGLVGLTCRCALRRAQNLRVSLGLLAGIQVLLLAAWVDRNQSLVSQERFLRPSMTAQAIRDFGRAWLSDRWSGSGTFTAQESAALEELSKIQVDLSLLDKTDVYVLFLESYGSCLFRGEETSSTERLLREIQAELTAKGYEACSKFVYPSVSGGNSALAHAELLSGVRVRERRTFDELVKSKIRPLPLFFKERGYEVIDAQPATEGRWPILDFFGFTKYAFQEVYGYEGPSYHYGRLPDQFALQHLLANEIRTSEKPVFLMYASVISHAPFSATPPYFTDWNDAARKGAAHWKPAKSWPIHWLNYFGHPDVERAFEESIRYSLRCASGFITQLERPSLIFVLGDHQPPVAGDLRKRDASADVPLHVISNRSELIERFAKTGFERGLIPSETSVSFSSSRFLYRFLRAMKP